jgi:hypothetical protein
VAHARVVVAFAVALAACGSSTKPVPPPPPAPAEPAAFTAGARMARFHSTRFGVSLPLPDGRRWRIDDHHAPVLRATHPPTGSLVELAVWREDELVNRAKCAERAREKGWAPAAGAREEISTEVVSFPPGWDTGIRVGADHDEKRVTGELVAFGAFIRKCLYFRFTTTAPLGSPDVVSDRLAFVRLRVFGGLSLDTFEVPREPMGSRTGP